ncbi:unnamed protein product [Fraxinus pennsylvanica]|uniref:F-box domain-containing protein n=1 Tax=Fraxinus pennsylvanica TaxID=56036 RepID=A0AAD2EC59_9LAMI|nr:unnamed protein product [Fraxinus pennsylvanica]
MEKDDQEFSINNVDGISELPDSICHHIMSFLPAKDARMTTFLARRWRSLWYSSPVYDFDQDSFVTDRIIWKFLEETLVRRKRNFSNLSIEKFRVCVHMSKIVDLRNIVWNWIGLAVRSNVKELSIINSERYYPIVPPALSISIFTAKSITKLEIVRFYFIEIGISLSLPSLQELVLRNTLMGCATLEKIICGCPVLKKLHLQSWKGGRELEISKETLTELHVKLDAPNLRGLDYLGKMATVSSVLSSPLLEVSIDMGSDGHNSTQYVKLKNSRSQKKCGWLVKRLQAYSYLKNHGRVSFIESTASRIWRKNKIEETISEKKMDFQ